MVRETYCTSISVGYKGTFLASNRFHFFRCLWRLITRYKRTEEEWIGQVKGGVPYRLYLVSSVCKTKGDFRFRRLDEKKKKTCFFIATVRTPRTSLGFWHTEYIFFSAPVVLY